MGRPSRQSHKWASLHNKCQKCKTQKRQVIFYFYINRLFVVCENKIFVFTFPTFENIDIIDTFQNPQGVIAISANTEETIIAYPDKSKGYVRIKSYSSQKPDTSLLNAHESQIACLSINYDGSLLVTASDKGTLLRLFKIDDGTLVQELRRGTENATIYSIAFDPQSKFLACTSDRGTIHIFTLANANKNIKEALIPPSESHGDHEFEGLGSEPKNKKSILGKITNFFNMKKNYFDSEWSFAQFRIQDSQAICSFGDNNLIVVIGNSGRYYQASFDPKVGGECTKVLESNFEIGVHQ